MDLLVLNSGSSSLKFRLFDVSNEGCEASAIKETVSGDVQGIGGQAVLRCQIADHSPVAVKHEVKDHEQAVRWVFERLEGRHISAVGHRVVHGGECFRNPVRIDESVLAKIQDLGELAPLHNPACLAGIRGAQQAIGQDLPMVAVFDTAFHSGISRAAATYAIDLDVAKKHGIRRYGFHGIAHASLARAYQAATRRRRDHVRIITLQLGNGCSAAAIEGGQSIDTSMGFTPLEGLVMGTRSGDLDPALVSYLGRCEGRSADEVERLLNTQSGLLGLSGLSQDMRTVLVAATQDPTSRAALAIDVFCYRVKKYIGAYLAALGGAEAIVFGGGIGERAPVIRAKICAGMEWCGLRLDPVRNERITKLASGEAVAVSHDGATVAAYVAGVDEEVEIARETIRCLRTPVSQGEG